MTPMRFPLNNISNKKILHLYIARGNQFRECNTIVLLFNLRKNLRSRSGQNGCPREGQRKKLDKHYDGVQ